MRQVVLREEVLLHDARDNPARKVAFDQRPEGTDREPKCLGGK